RQAGDEPPRHPAPPPRAGWVAPVHQSERVQLPLEAQKKPPAAASPRHGRGIEVRTTKRKDAPVTTTVNRYSAPSAGFVRGVAALSPDTIAAQADDLRFLARLNLDEHPNSPTAHALLRGVELLILKTCEEADLPAPDDIPVIAPELMRA